MNELIKLEIATNLFREHSLYLTFDKTDECQAWYADHLDARPFEQIFSVWLKTECKRKLVSLDHVKISRYSSPNPKVFAFFFPSEKDKLKFL